MVSFKTSVNDAICQLIISKQGEPQAIEVLCHEWADALAWNYSADRASKIAGFDPSGFERLCHDEAWGCGFSRVYCAYLDIGVDGA